MAVDPPSLAGCFAKIDRADENLRNLQREFASFIKESAYTAVRQPDDDPGTATFKVVKVESVPLRLRVLVGEIAHHIRSSLDLLVYQLMVRAGVTDPRRLESCAFPVVLACNPDVPTEWKKYEASVRGKIQGINGDAMTQIERLQPCWNGGDSSFVAQIANLDNIDKHRLLLALVGSLQIGGFNFRESDGSVVTLPHHAYLPIHPDAMIKTSPFSFQMNVNLQLPFEIAFGEEGILWCQPVVPTLQNLADITRRTLTTFVKFF
jgi:hypothetical protein